MLSRMFNNLVTFGVYLVAIPAAVVLLTIHLTRWMIKDMAREWRS